MAHIAPYPGGRWRAQVRKAGFKAVSDIFPTKAKAEAWARKTESDMEQHTYRDPSKFAKDTIGEIFERYRDEVCPNRKGGRWEKVRINKFLREAEFMQRRVEQIQPVDIRNWRNERVKQVNPRSVNREMNLLSTVFSHAIEEWEYHFPGEGHPVKAVARPEGSGVKYRHRRWSTSELEAILKAAEHDESKAPVVGRDYVSWALLLGLETAMRPGEFCGAKVKDVKLENRCIVLADSKNGHGRQVPLSKRAVEICRRLTEGKRPEADLIPISSESLGVYYREIRKKAGLAEADLRFYDIKHESISRLSKKFSNVLELSAVTGHRSLQSLKFYYNPTVDELAAKLD